MILKKLLLLFLVFSSFTAFAQSNRIDEQKDLILKDSLPPAEVMLKLQYYEKWGTAPIAVAEWEQIKNLLLSNNTNGLSLCDEYFICYADCNRLHS